MSDDRSPVRIGIVVGEVSGDFLGAGLMRALKRRLPHVQFEGVCGPQMQAEGCRTLFPMERLSIMGLFEALQKYPQILGMRRCLVRHFREHPPDLFIGVDLPDFNLSLEHTLHGAGIPTMHYVSPTVWAWRSYRIHKIRKAVDHMLTLFPFEARHYREHGIPVTFVGHPLADQIADDVDRAAARRRLGLPADRRTVALLPGSRASELHRHADLFVRTALWLHERNPGLIFVAAFASRGTRELFETALDRNEATHLPILLKDNQAREAMAAADVVLLASGTATLEAALLKRLMVVTYRVSWFNYLLVRLFSHIKLYSLPNNLAGRELVPELLQRAAVPARLGQAIERYLSNPEVAGSVRQELAEIHHQLRRNADERAAEAVCEVLKARHPARALVAAGDA